MSICVLVIWYEWLQKPIAEDFKLPRWTIFILLILLFFVLVALRMRAKHKKQYQQNNCKHIDGLSNITFNSAVQLDNEAENKDSLEVFNLQGLGSREEQQDRFTLSPLDNFAEQGFLALICDGMGGLEDGALIADELSKKIRSIFPATDFANAISQDGDVSVLAELWVKHLEQLSEVIHAKHGDKGGSTLIQVYLYQNNLLFWSVGDSDLFLLRNQRLYALNLRHEYINTLYLDAAYSGSSLTEVVQDPQAAALSHFMGRYKIRCDYCQRTFSLQSDDRLLLCSDGVSDTLSHQQLTDCLNLSKGAVLSEVEAEILKQNKVNQDNYTAILIAVNQVLAEASITD